MRMVGVEVRVRPSFVVLGLLTAFTAAPAIRDQVPALGGFAVGFAAAVIALGLLVSVLLHELAHAAVGLRLGLPVERVDLTVLGGATSLGDEPRSARDQYLVSVSGPVVNLLLGGVFAIVSRSTADGTVVHLVTGLLAAVNVLLALYNLLPGLPLDGGQLVRAVVWKLTGDKITGLRAAGVGGMLTAGATLAVGVLELRSSVLGLLTIVVGLFVGMQAQGAFVGAALARRLPAVVAGRLARPAYLAGADLPLAEALRRAAALGRSAVVLGVDGRPSAVLSDVLLEAVPEPRRPWVSLSSVSRPAPQTSWLDADLTGEDLVTAMGRAESATEYVVMHDGALVGVLRRADVASRLKGRRR